MHGAKSFRHVYLFEKGVIICKKREDGAMSCKTSIMVSLMHRYKSNVKSMYFLLTYAKIVSELLTQSLSRIDLYFI